MDSELTKRMGENDRRHSFGAGTGMTYIGISDEGREGTDGRALPVYSIGAGTEGRIYTMGEVDG